MKYVAFGLMITVQIGNAFAQGSWNSDHPVIKVVNEINNRALVEYAKNGGIRETTVIEIRDQVIKGSDLSLDLKQCVKAALTFKRWDAELISQLASYTEVMLENAGDMRDFIEDLKGEDFADVYASHSISLNLENFHIEMRDYLFLIKSTKKSIMKKIKPCLKSVASKQTR